jgi:hypothetical protein
MITEEMFLQAYETVIKYHAQVLDSYKKAKEIIDIAEKLNSFNKNDSIDKLNISIRLRNAMRAYFGTYHKLYDAKCCDLSLIDIDKFKSLRNVGKSSVDELKALLTE